jgi:hypothetical protein
MHCQIAGASNLGPASFGGRFGGRVKQVLVENFVDAPSVRENAVSTPLFFIVELVQLVRKGV